MTFLIHEFSKLNKNYYVQYLTMFYPDLDECLGKGRPELKQCFVALGGLGSQLSSLSELQELVVVCIQKPH